MNAAVITFAVAVLGLIGVLAGHIVIRLNELENDLEETRREHRALWLYTRRLLDQYYRFRRPDAPDPDPLPD